jgi:hypothetical protein
MRRGRRRSSAAGERSRHRTTACAWGAVCCVLSVHACSPDRSQCMHVGSVRPAGLPQSGTTAGQPKRIAPKSTRQQPQPQSTDKRQQGGTHGGGKQGGHGGMSAGCGGSTVNSHSGRCQHSGFCAPRRNRLETSVFLNTASVLALIVTAHCVVWPPSQPLLTCCCNRPLSGRLALACAFCSGFS